MRLMTPTGRLASVGACPAPTTPGSKFAHAAENAALHVLRGLVRRRCLRALLTNYCFTISVFIAVAITAMFAYVFEASQEQFATLVVFGILTAVAEYVLRSNSERRPRRPP
jgi:hypothetical protein